MGKMDELEKIVNQDLLFDCYGDLLTGHQKRIYEEVVFNDYSISEVAKDEGISRQGVSDMIRRSSEQLTFYEKKLGLVKKYKHRKKKLEEIKKLTGIFQRDRDPEHVSRIEEIAGELLKEG